MSPLHKRFKIPGDRLRQLILKMGACFASDRITEDGLKVGYMYRESSDDVSSGWTFMAGDESQEYADNPDNWAIYEVNTICNYDPAIIPHLGAARGSAFRRLQGGEAFLEEPLNGL